VGHAAVVRIGVTAVTLRGLTKGTIQNLSLDVHEGEFLVLLGRPGSGKTTVLRCIAGLDEPASGDILFGERVVTHEPPARRGVAMLFSGSALYPHLTVRENIAFPLEMRGLATADIATRVDETAGRLGLAAVLDRRPAELSAEDRQRAALGRAIVRAPQVVLLDEPLASVDVRRTELRAELLALHRGIRVTMLYATDDPVEAMTMGERVAVLDQGRLRQVGTPAEVYERPADVTVARLVGSPGMNVLTGRVRAPATKRSSAGGERVIEAGSLAVPIELATYEGELQLGIRPEHVGLCAADQGVGNGDVLIVEPRGNETLVHLNLGGQGLIARLPGFVDVRVGTRVGVKIDRRRLHLFDAAGTPLA
jgi:multiple sugar transport system ATP-binding protein